MILYQEIAPHKKLAEYILSYWKFEYHPPATPGKPPELLDHTVLPDGCVSLIFHFNQQLKQRMLLLFGPRVQNFSTQVHPCSIFVGVRFFPGVAHALFNISGAALRDQTLPAVSLTGTLRCQPILEQLSKGFDSFDLLDDRFLEYIDVGQFKTDSQITRAVHLIVAANGNIRVSEIAEKVHLSERQLQRKFKETVGLTPKEFARIRRIRAALIKMVLEEQELQDVIYNAGYFDQAHFIRDFGGIAGTNPTVFRKYIARIEHRNILPPDAKL